MNQRLVLLTMAVCVLLVAAAMANDIDQRLNQENTDSQVTLAPTAVVDDLTFLRRASVDLIGRIPSRDEILQYKNWPAETRRQLLIEKLVAEDRFADRWTTFFGDMLRLRTGATGGAALTAYVHQALSENTPYDKLCQSLIAASGKANSVPEVGFILGDQADPLAMAAVTAQVFLGTRLSCAQCHDHPFDVWTREDFYSLAAYFGKTRQVTSQRTRVVYISEAGQTTVMWPPEDMADGEKRKPMTPRFAFDLVSADQLDGAVARLNKLRQQEKFQQSRQTAQRDKRFALETLLAASAEKARLQTNGQTDLLGVATEAKSAIRGIDTDAALYGHSELRAELAKLITNPRNQLFAQSFVNRVWKELLGRGFVDPVDDFREDNPPSHPATLNYLANEFVANGYDFRFLVKKIVTSDAYARSHVSDDQDQPTRELLESSFLATPMRRMLGEALYDSIVTAGDLFEVKYPAGANETIVRSTIRVAVAKKGEQPAKTPVARLVEEASKAEMPAAMEREIDSGYALEDAVELDFASLLKDKNEPVKLDQMAIISAEEIEAKRMAMEAAQRKSNNDDDVTYVTKTIERVVDNNPRFNSSFRMASPAPAGHFVRVFGQTSREDLGDIREDVPSMRQALMMLNGRLTHEASRVGSLEPIYELLTQPEPDIIGAIRMAYERILTRVPSAEEIADGEQIIAAAGNPLAGMADLRWLLLNCNEFRFLP